MFFRNMLRGGGEGDENLDRPLTNFDVIGVPTGGWSSGFFSCHQNILPSCLLSFFCPCVQWSQVVVRAQIPLLIGLKNSFPCSRNHSGYGTFIEFYFWSALIAIGLILVLVFVDISSNILVIFLGLVIAVVILVLAFLVGHTRTAFKEKYEIPSTLPPGCYFWDMLLDALVTCVCFPCAISQYDRLDTPLGIFFSDPSILPPLRPLDSETSSVFVRPARADQAGLHWTTDAAHPLAQDNRGRAHREQGLVRDQVQQLRGSSAPTATATPVGSPVYRADGSAV